MFSTEKTSADSLQLGEHRQCPQQREVAGRLGQAFDRELDYVTVEISDDDEKEGFESWVCDI
jgi:hypothetical protein